MGKVIEGMFRSPSRLGSEAGYRTHKIFLILILQLCILARDTVNLVY